MLVAPVTGKNCIVSSGNDRIHQKKKKRKGIYTKVVYSFDQNHCTERQYHEEYLAGPDLLIQVGIFFHLVC